MICHIWKLFSLCLCKTLARLPHQVTRTAARPPFAQARHRYDTECCLNYYATFQNVRIKEQRRELSSALSARWRQPRCRRHVASALASCQPCSLSLNCPDQQHWEFSGTKVGSYTKALAKALTGKDTDCPTLISTGNKHLKPNLNSTQ